MDKKPMEFERDCVIYCFSYCLLFLYFYFLGCGGLNHRIIFIVSPIYLNVIMLKLKGNIYP